jgi:hypothetical protein
MGFLNQSPNAGVDLVSLTITNASNGAIVVLDGRRTRFSSNDTPIVLKGKYIDGGGRPSFRVLPDGWEGTIEVDKMDDDFGELYRYIEAQKLAGGGEVKFTISKTVQLADASATHTEQYQGCVFHTYHPGDYTKESIVKSTFQFSGETCVTLS